MGTEVTTTRQLTGIAKRLATEHEAFVKSANTSLEHAKRAGELLLEAKELVDHGDWESWLSGHFPGDLSTAQIYMRLARRWPEVEAKAECVPLLSLRGAVKLLAKPHEKPDIPPANPAMVAVAQQQLRNGECSTIDDILDQNAEREPPESLLRNGNPPDEPDSQSEPEDASDASVGGGEPSFEPDLESIPMTRASREIAEWCRALVERIRQRHPKTRAAEAREFFAMAVEGVDWD